MKRKLSCLFVGLFFFACLRFYLMSPLYVLSDIFYFMPASAMDNYDGEGKQGMVWFPVTRIQHMRECELA